MKHQKFLFIALFAMAFTAIQSCDEKLSPNTEYENVNDAEKEVAIEITQSKECYQFIESVLRSTDREFLEGDFMQNVPAALRVRASETGDTIKSAEEIPVYSSQDINHKIYVDGTYQYINLNTTPVEENLFNDLNVHNQPLNDVVSKTIVKDGVAYLYNIDGDLIHSKETGTSNYSALLDSLRSAIASGKTLESSPQAAKALQSRRITNAIHSAKNAGMNLISQSDDEIVFEMNLGAAESTLPQRVKASVQRKAVMRFSTDMTCMYEQKVYENNQLVQIVRYEYQADNAGFAKRAPQAVKNLLPNTSVKGITLKSLKVKNDGTPYVMVNKEHYKKNQVTINL
jgi:hypothetical protein